MASGRRATDHDAMGDFQRSGGSMSMPKNPRMIAARDNPRLAERGLTHRAEPELSALREPSALGALSNETAASRPEAIPPPKKHLTIAEPPRHLSKSSSVRGRAVTDSSQSSVHVPLMPIAVEPAVTLNSTNETVELDLTSQALSKSLNKSARREGLTSMLRNSGESRRKLKQMSEQSREDSSSGRRPTSSFRRPMSRGLRAPPRPENSRKFILESGIANFTTLNEWEEGKFPVFFAGGSVTVRGWATGNETMLGVKYLCLKAFGSLDKALEEELIKGEISPQFLEWPSAEEFMSRVGAHTNLADNPLHPGCILEVRSPKWLDGIRNGRERAMLEALLAPMSRFEKYVHSMNLMLNEPSSSNSARITAYIILTLIVISTLTLCLETLPWYYSHTSSNNVWFFIEAACISIFTLELLARFLVSDNKLKFLRSHMNIIDAIAIFPFYLEILAQGANIPGLSVLRVTRLARVLRLFKVSQGPVHILARTMSDSLQPMYSLAVVILIAAVMFAALMYYAERGTYNSITGNWEHKIGTRCPVECTDDIRAIAAVESGLYDDCLNPNSTYVMVDYLNIQLYNWQPPRLMENGTCITLKEKAPFDSIPICCWWSIVTMTTLGYGDMVPITFVGKCVGMVCMLSGILVVALPVTIIGQNFSHVYKEEIAAQKRTAEIKKRKRELAKEAQAAQAKLDMFKARTFKVVSAGLKFKSSLSMAPSRRGSSEHLAPEQRESSTSGPRPLQAPRSTATSHRSQSHS